MEYKMGNYNIVFLYRCVNVFYFSYRRHVVSLFIPLNIQILWNMNDNRFEYFLNAVHYGIWRQQIKIARWQKKWRLITTLFCIGAVATALLVIVTMIAIAES